MKLKTERLGFAAKLPLCLWRGCPQGGGVTSVTRSFYETLLLRTSFGNVFAARRG